MKNILFLTLFLPFFSFAQNDTTVYSITDKMPIYKQGGTEGFVSFLKANFHKPNTDTISGRVIVTFTIEKNGETSNPMIVKSLSKTIDNEAFRVVSLLKFLPAKIKGKPVRSKFTLPLSIKY